MEAGERGDGLFRIKGGREGEGEGVEAGAGLEEGEDGVGGGSPCGTGCGVLFGADGEGSDVCAVVSRDMADEGGEGGGGGERYVGEDRGETECTGGGRGGGECADGIVGKDVEDGEVEFCGEDVPGHGCERRRK